MALKPHGLVHVHPFLAIFLLQWPELGSVETDPG